MIRSHILVRRLMNLELSKKQIISSYTEDELTEISQIGKASFSNGAVGEFGIRKELEKFTEVNQNFCGKTNVYWYDWIFPHLLGSDGPVYWEVKSQPWWERDRMELVLQDNHSGQATNFVANYEKIDTLLIWSIKNDFDTITPLAMIDPKGVIKESSSLVKGGGHSVNLRTLHERGYLFTLNDAWKNKLLNC